MTKNYKNQTEISKLPILKHSFIYKEDKRKSHENYTALQATSQLLPVQTDMNFLIVSFI